MADNKVYEIVRDNLLKQLEEIGFAEIIYTDLRRSGTMRGPNMEGLQEIMSATKLKLWVAGGVADYDTIEKLKAQPGVKGIIMGKAIYTGAVDLRKALSLVRA